MFLFAPAKVADLKSLKKKNTAKPKKNEHTSAAEITDTLLILSLLTGRRLIDPSSFGASARKPVPLSSTLFRET